MSDQVTGSVRELQNHDGVDVMRIEFSNMSTLSVARHDGGTRYELQHSIIGAHSCTSLEEVVGWISTKMPAEEASVLLGLIALRA